MEIKFEKLSEWQVENIKLSEVSRLKMKSRGYPFP